MTAQGQLYAMLGAWAVLMYGILVSATRSMSAPLVLPPLAVLAASPLLILALAVAVEHRAPSELFDLRKQAWSFTIGDTFVLTTAMVYATKGWRLLLPQEGWYRSWWWPVVAGLVGLLAGTAFHKWDSGNYRRVGAEALLKSPTKIAHDFVAYPVLFGAVICLGVPLVVYAIKTHWTMLPTAFTVCLGIWVILVVVDGLRKLNVFDFHSAWDAVRFSRL